MLEYINLHEYQKHSSQFILDHHLGALFLNCGLGKTVITLTALNELLFDRFEISKVLIICPLRVGEVWNQEIEKWSHLKNIRCSLALGTETERKKALLQKADIYVINRENVPWLVNNYSYLFDGAALVIDESSSFKNPKAKRFKSLLRIRHKFKRVILLSATPASNNLIDLWSQFKLLDMGERLGRFITNYRNNFFEPDKRNGQIVFSYKPLPGSEDKIYKRISDITISMKSIDYLKMPECVINKVLVTMNEKEWKVYSSFKEDMVTKLDDNEIDAVNAAVLSGKLLQMANGAVYDEKNKAHFIHDRKLDALEDLIEGANGKPVLIAYWFKHDLDRIQKRFPVRQLKSSKDIEEWNEGEIPVAVIHPASAGHGLNLQSGGSTLVWFGLTWSLELYQQTNARLYRQGQKDTVVIHHIITKDTIDEDVMTALTKKEKTQASLIEAVKAKLEVKR